MLNDFGPSLYVAEGPTVSFAGFPYPTRMALARLSDGGVWVWSPIALTPQLADAVQAIGPVRHIVSPNKLHHLFLPAWAEHWPHAQLHAPPGLARKKKALHFESELGNEPPSAWQQDIDQVVFGGSFAMNEVVFFHRASRTAIVGDLIQRFPAASVSGWKGWVMKLGGLVGEHGGTPPDWRASFLRHGPARAALHKVLAWNPQRLLIAHGMCAQAGAAEIIAAALRWI
ncbi:MAG: DUF4336 domain-containing protein [Xanthomonadales bacterium PRO7]|nr:DUF4336 domain-containing protein [Xanthomonadales bacterium PRO7]